MHEKIHNYWNRLVLIGLFFLLRWRVLGPYCESGRCEIISSWWLLQDTSEKLKVFAYVWRNSTDPALYGEWDLEVNLQPFSLSRLRYTADSLPVLSSWLNFVVMSLFLIADFRRWEVWIHPIFIIILKWILFFPQVLTRLFRSFHTVASVRLSFTTVFPLPTHNEFSIHFVLFLCLP